MNTNPHSGGADYLTTEVMTASPQKLRLMLIEAALRFAMRARQGWSENRGEEASEAMIRCQQIVCELLAGLNAEPGTQAEPSADPELIRRIAGIYMFIYRSLIHAQLHRDEVKLGEAISVLEIERETWRQVCAGAGGEQANRERAGSERAGSERAGSERAGSERAGSERAGSERATDRASTLPATTSRPAAPLAAPVTTPHAEGPRFSLHA